MTKTVELNEKDVAGLKEYTVASLTRTAQCNLDSLVEMVDALRRARRIEDGEEEAPTDEEVLSFEDALQRIQEDPLSIEVRSGWYTPGSTPEPEEFKILLGTGGPAVRIVGELDNYDQPSSATLQVQDWFTPWVSVVCTTEEREKLLEYAQQFYFSA